VLRDGDGVVPVLVVPSPEAIWRAWGLVSTGGGTGIGSLPSADVLALWIGAGVIEVRLNDPSRPTALVQLAPLTAENVEWVNAAIELGSTALIMTEHPAPWAPTFPGLGARVVVSGERLVAPRLTRPGLLHGIVDRLRGGR